MISFIKEGRSKLEAARVFKVNPDTLYEWLKRGEDLIPRPAKARKRKIDRAALLAHVGKYPDLILRERVKETCLSHGGGLRQNEARKSMAMSQAIIANAQILS